MDENREERRQAERAHDNHTRFIEHLNKASIDSGTLAIRSALLINGGAAIALLAYVGTLEIKESSTVIGSLVWFALGVAAAAFGTAFAFMANFTQVTGETSKRIKWDYPYIFHTNSSRIFMWLMYFFQISSIIAGAASLILFIYGMYQVEATISGLASSDK